MSDFKDCTICGRTLPLDAFHLDKKGALGRRSQCRTCRNALMNTGNLIYIMVHPLFTPAIKIGRARNRQSRLSMANVHCPDKAFKFVFVHETPNAIKLEEAVHHTLRLYRGEGEWFYVPIDDAIRTIYEVEERLYGDA